MENILNQAEKEDLKHSQVLFQAYSLLIRGVRVTPEQGDFEEIRSSSFALSKVSLTICKSEISPNKTKLKHKCVFFSFFL